ncbi:DNA topoisomerase (ATP-hydrolyzing) [Cyberlindnera jadinii NRRL Y-1542]|uniref:DNA topoisomerase (ATP-hydrolyzing) n=1 Tax=Cyberlindnera jadinii (strain ATCC 18201 / CBS 1600 / BCRC 20928 / JCM 3617 / NBRC 0987 / NRRL Y-1542) TaxID=983966 RepID=A0A1E4RWL0_CYBJN|nr:DNA topoisomerase IV, alpha subunit [Cyberlindnera jadinii NRRL Y-1542]ODV71581.1 DNA topoisomerase IV, alpha subunit [Cyberlindnera jadinii NRRL Y-1542]
MKSKRYNTFVDKLLTRQTRRCVTFPADTKAESNRFTQCIRLISLLIENLTLKNTVTRRDLYYQDVQLFKSQSVVDSLIELFTQCMNITGEELGAIAAQKGLMVGDVTLHCPNGVLTDYRCFGNAMLIPRFGNGTVITLISEVDYILIVEKEAVLSQLIKSKEKRLLICGKGYADVLTKTFVNLLSRCLPDVPILGIADFDPYGFLILENYRSGKGHLDQSCPHLQYTKASILHFIKGSSILNLTLRDFKKCVKLLHTLDLSNLRARQEVQRLMVLGKKAELDVIKDPDGELVHYIDRMCRLSLK